MNPLSIAVSGLHRGENPQPGAGIIRSLRRALPGARFVGLVYDIKESGIYAEDGPDEVQLMPYPSAGRGPFLERLDALLKRTPVDLLIPSLDAEIELLVHLRAELAERRVRVCLPDSAVLRRRAKAHLPSLARACGIAVPETRIAHDLGAAREAVRELGCPLMIKGAYYEARRAHHAAQAHHAAAALLAEWGAPVILQRCVAGPEFNVLGLGDGRGGLAGSCSIRKTALSNTGKGLGGIVVRDARLDRIVEGIIRELRWPGPFEIELIHDEAARDYVLIEMNPRFPAWIDFPTQIGANFPAALVHLLRHGATGEPLPACAPGTFFLRHQIEVVGDISRYASLLAQEADSFGDDFPARPALPAIFSHETQSYLPPLIQRLGAEPSNPFRLGSVPPCAAIDGVAVADLAEQHGSPLFVFSETQLRAKFREAHRAFSRRYPDVRFAWSYKTNYLNAICRIFHQEGAIAEVVSEFEYEKARGNGIPGCDIIFNGPYKRREILERAVAEGAMIQVDNLDELLLLGEIARGRPRGEPVAIALRVHLDTGTHAVWSKFGFNADNGEALRIVRRLQQMPGLRLQGLHAHIGTFILEPDAYRRSAAVLVRLALEAEKLGAGPIRYLNCGGGFASHARLHGQYLPPEQATPGFDRYAEAICDTIIQAWPAHRPLPRLYLETGRALVDDAGYLISTVVAVKRQSPVAAPALDGVLGAYGKGPVAMPSPQRSGPALVVDAGVHLLYTSAWYQPAILPAKASPDLPMPTTVYGCLCMNIDVIREEAPLPALGAGDHVVLHPVGAYNITQSMQFIAYRPAVVMIGLDGAVHVIRRRENLDYVQELEAMPAHLRDGPAETEARLTPLTARLRRMKSVAPSAKNRSAA